MARVATFRLPRSVGYSSGQRGQTVNLLSSALRWFESTSYHHFARRFRRAASGLATFLDSFSRHHPIGRPAPLQSAPKLRTLLVVATRRARHGAIKRELMSHRRERGLNLYVSDLKRAFVSAKNR